jgi:predicted nucleotidyltransferase
MKTLGLVVEYNPFHNGHLHHIQKAKEIVQPDITIVVMSGNFVQRGEPAIVDKWIRTNIALEHGIDLVVELPFVYAVESADYFAKGSITILQNLHITDLVFGSENGDINILSDIAIAIKKEKTTYQQYIQSFMQQGYCYPDACNQALSLLLNKSITTPNDLLGLAYVKEIINHDYPITMHCIPRTNQYHSTKLQNISSATAIRKALKEHLDISHQLPCLDQYTNPVYLENFFSLLRYKILTTSAKELQQLHLVEEGIENLLKKNITQVTTMDAFINSLTSRRYTRSRMQRMILHILMHNNKEEVTKAMNIDYIRILGMNTTGQKYLNSIKKELPFILVSSFKKHLHPALDIELKAAYLYSCITNSPNKTITEEYTHIPIIKK